MLLQEKARRVEVYRRVLALKRKRREAAEESLLEFIRQGWHVLEPATPFVEGRALHALCLHLEAVTKGEIRQLLINWQL